MNNQNNSHQNLEFLNSKEAASFLRISVPRLMNLTSNGKLPYYKFQRSNRYLKKELEKILLSEPRGIRDGN